MSWWRKPQPNHTPVVKSSVITIPEDFYAGQNPEVIFRSSVGKNSANLRPNLTTADKKALDRATQIGAGDEAHPVKLLSGRKTFVWIFSVIFIVGILGATIYYFVISKQTTKPAPNSVPEVLPVVEVAPTGTEPVVEPTSTVSEVPQETKPSELPFTTVSISTSDSSDTDQDGLSDLEEELFKTDPNLADSDQDKYSDSHEVYNLYNPAGKEPMKLSDSGLTANFQNPTYGFQIYYPISWATGNVDPDFRDVLFSTFTGEYVRVHVFDRQNNENLPDFLARVIPGDNVTDYIPFESRFNVSGFRRSDFMTYVWFNNNNVVVMAYNLPPQTNVANYRTVIKMMARSFRLGPSNIIIPDQIVESPTSTTFVTTTASVTTTPL